MLVIVKSAFEYYRRPKYYPLNRWPCYVVIDSETEERKCEPTTLAYANKIMLRENNANKILE